MMTPRALPEGRARCPQRAAVAQSLTQVCQTPDAGRARRSARAVVEAHDYSPTQRVLTAKSATILLSFVIAFLAACATSTNNPTASSTPLRQRQVKVTVATNDLATAQNNQQTQTQTSSPTSLPRARVLPLTARIASVNEKLHFVVVDFTNSRQPQIDERLSVYRVGEKVAEIKISGPYRNTTVAADIVAGEVKYGDEVKTE